MTKGYVYILTNPVFKMDCVNIGTINNCRTSVFGCWCIEGENDSLNVRRIKKTLVTVFSNC